MDRNTEPVSNTEPTTAEPTAAEPTAAEPTAAEPKTAEPNADPTKTKSEPDKDGGEVKGNTKTISNFFNSIVGGMEGKEGGDNGSDEPETMPETDEAWTDAAIADNENDVVREFAGSIAGQMREAGILPSQYAKVAEIVCKKLREQDAADKEIREKAAAELTAIAQKTFGKSEWKDIEAGSEAYVPKDSMLYKVLTQTELGSDIAMLTILRRLGESARADTPPSNRAGGTGESSSLEQRLFRRSFPNS